MFNIFAKSNRQSGQTLIETMVAVFIMVMGITAALGLANYSLNASGGIRNQIIGMGLAREGIEAFKNMRDTNWLNDTIDSTCYNFATAQQGNADSPAPCYRNWLNASAAGGYDIAPPVGKDAGFALDFDTSTGQFWRPTKVVSGKSSLYQLYYDSDGSPNGFYTHNADDHKPSSFSRQVLVQDETLEPPFDQDTGPRVVVISRVWWTDAKCPASSTWPGKGRCAIELQMHMTNWKTF